MLLTAIRLPIHGSYLCDCISVCLSMCVCVCMGRSQQNGLSFSFRAFYLNTDSRVVDSWLSCVFDNLEICL